MTRTLLGITLQKYTKNEILEYVIDRAKNRRGFTHVVSLNPEIMVLAQDQSEFKACLNRAHLRLIDGVGVRIAATLMGIPAGDRLSGVDLMAEAVSQAGGLRLTVALLGGHKDLAESLANRYSQAYPEARFIGIQGIKNIKDPQKIEEIRIKTQIADLRPHLVFVSFGSPAQELWIDSHRELFKNSVCIGVGGAFDFLGGRVPRAPGVMRSLGLEWLFRLWVQPWRWRRQLRLVRFAVIVIRQRLWNRES